MLDATNYKSNKSLLGGIHFLLLFSGVFFLLLFKIYDTLYLIAIFFFLHLLIKVNFFHYQWRISQVSIFISILYLFIATVVVGNASPFSYSHVFGVIKIYLIVVIFYIIRLQYPSGKFKYAEDISFAIIYINLIFNGFQFIFPDNLWNFYTYILHYKSLHGVSDGLVGIFGSRTINSHILFLGLLYFLISQKRFFALLSMFFILLSNIKVVIFVSIILFITKWLIVGAKNAKSINIFHFILYLFLFLLFTSLSFFYLAFEFHEFNFLFSNSYLARINTFQGFYDLWINDISLVFLGYAFEYEAAVDSQWLLIMSRHGIFILALILILSIYITKSWVINFSLIIFGVTAQFLYSPLILLIFFGIISKLRDKT